MPRRNPRNQRTVPPRNQRTTRPARFAVRAPLAGPVRPGLAVGSAAAADARVKLALCGSAEGLADDSRLRPSPLLGAPPATVEGRRASAAPRPTPDRPPA